MTERIADRCQFFANTFGTGNHTILATPHPGSQTFAAVFTADGDTGYFVAFAGPDWEVFKGTRVNATTLARTTMIASNNANNAVSWPAGITITIANTVPAAVFAAQREVLTAARTYYVRADGNDSNTGLVDSAAGAFLTIQKAINVVAGLDIRTHNVTITVRAGTFAGFSVVGAWLGSGVVKVSGDTTTPANVALSSGIFLTSGARLSIEGMKITSANFGVSVSTGSVCTASGKMEYGAITIGQIYCGVGGSFVNNGVAYTISGAAAAHWMCDGPGANILVQSSTITISGTPAFSSAFAVAAAPAMMTVNANTFSGSATGSRYAASVNGIIQTFGGGATYLPGNAAGSTATGGQYL